jgi:DNA-binding response OmpR family regulator
MTKKVLVADDEQNIVISIEFLLKREGFEVFVASDGESALQMIGEHRPDLVLLDVMMPKRNGYEVCQQIRADSALKDVKVIMLTAKGREIEIAKGMALGADAYVTKPFSTTDLVAKAKQMLGLG